MKLNIAYFHLEINYKQTFKMSLFIFSLAVISVVWATPRGDSPFVNLIKYLLWWIELVNTKWWLYFKLTVIGIPLAICLLAGCLFPISLVLYFFTNIEFIQFLLNPMQPLVWFIGNFSQVFVEQSGRKHRVRQKRKIMSEIRHKDKERSQSRNAARDRKHAQMENFDIACTPDVLFNPYIMSKIKVKSDNNVLSEQAGISDKYDCYIRELTLLETLRRVLCSVSDKSGMVSALVMYAQAHTSKSLVSHFVTLMRGTVDLSNDILTLVDTLHEQSGMLEDDWIKQMRACLSDWKRYKHSKVSKSFINLVNYIVSVGLCDKAKLTFSIGNMKLFTPTVTKRQLAAADLFELLAETVIGFVEGGWRAYSTQRISAFFGAEDEFTEFETYYVKIKDTHGFSLTGNLQRHAGMNENDYELLLDQAVISGERLLKTFEKAMTFEKKFVCDRLDKIRDYRNEFIQVRTRGGLRVAPFGVSLYGDSAVGKSTLNQLTYEAIGKYNNINVEPDRVATWADNDKFASNIRASTNVIVFDDFGNTTPKFMDFSPCYRLIQCVNNALFTAPMAEVNLKGKVGLHPWIVMITTNVEHLLSNVYSEKPESILRRFYHVKVQVKPEFCTDGKLDEHKIYAKFGFVKVPDCWMLSVRSCCVGGLVASGSDRRRYELKPIEFEGKVMKDVSVHDYLRWAQVTSKKHYEQQKGLVETMRADTQVVCSTCGFYGCNCQAPMVPDTIPLVVDETMEEHAGIIRITLRVLFLFSWICLNYLWGLCVGSAMMWFKLASQGRHFSFIDILMYNIDSTVETVRNYTRAWFGFVRLVYERVATPRLLEFLDFLENGWINDYIVFLPESVVNSNFYLFALMWQRRFSICVRQWFYIVVTILVYVNAIVLLLHGRTGAAIGWFIIANLSVGFLLAAERATLQEELLDRQAVFPAWVNWMRRHYILTTVGVIGTIYAAVSFWREGRKLTCQGALIPTSMEDIEERDKEENPWARFEATPLPMTIESKTTTSSDLINLCLRNTVVVKSEQYVVRGFLLTSNALMVPYHFLRIHREAGYSGDIKVKCYRNDENMVGGNFREVLSESMSYRIPNTDFIVFYSPSSGSVANVIKFLPTSLVSTCDARFVLKNHDSEDIISPILFQSQRVTHTSLSFDGGKYVLNYETFPGLCMSPLVSNGHGSCILGFHLCGKGKIGGAGTVTQSQALDAVNALSSLDGCILTAANGVFPKEQYGVHLLGSVEVHRKSATRFVTPGNSLEVYGSSGTRVTPHSNVVPTKISPFVEEVMGVPQQWGPPLMRGKGVYPYQAALETLAHPSLSLGSLIRPAVVCYRSVFSKIKERIPALFNETRPLTEVETVSGKDGVRFIDPLNMSSSPGWPFSGRKDKMVIDLNPNDYPGISRPRTFEPRIWNEFYRCKEILLRHERPYFVWKACLKDEPTKKTKTKVRVFQSAPLVLQLMIRMYFLPIVRIIQCNPLEAECMVGVNAEGPEWEQMNAFMTSKGPNILAGDYSKYDQRMPAQLVIAAFDVLIWIAATLCDYADEDLTIMRGLVGEIAFPLMCYNGDLLMLFGSNPSGQNLTVIINSIVNVLLLRSCYYSIYPLDAACCRFREFVAAGSYGDDLKSSVSHHRPLFHHIAFADFLQQFDIIFTMPDKESIATKYMDANSADFLKRINMYHEELQINVGVLSEASIFKRLHSHLISKELSFDMQSAFNIDSSLHDWFYYGRQVFETRRSQLALVAQRAEIYHLCRGFDMSYNERVARWNYRYRGLPMYDSLSEVTLESAFEEQD